MGQKYVLAAEVFKWNEAAWNNEKKLVVDTRFGKPWVRVSIKGLDPADMEPLMILEFDGTEGIDIARWLKHGTIYPLADGVTYDYEPHVVKEWWTTASGDVEVDVFYGARTVLGTAKVEPKGKGKKAEPEPEPEPEPVMEPDEPEGLVL